ncbi:hypothetical protein N7535_006403 [Penicillium sp. DV-2018c]|nr:hypothetical protein N7461_007518 [Penicillium sp. DV-2018c]KAJ5567097.1 hypothetical protein N7535_006403 [Penicillium sp. DV-2018c]
MYLGMEISRDRRNNHLSLCQWGYIDQILQRLGFEYSKPAYTPMDAKACLEPAPEDYVATRDCRLTSVLDALHSLRHCIRDLQAQSFSGKPDPRPHAVASKINASTGNVIQIPEQVPVLNWAGVFEL